MAMKTTPLTRAAAHARISLDHRPLAHFLHIGKNAGTAMKAALRQAQGSAKYRVLVHTHEVRLTGISEIDHYFFCVRDPIERYVSGFLSRQRQGQPRFFNAWNEGETEAFARFHSPDALAVSLSAGGTEQRDAEAAMRAIRQVRTSYWDWFRDPEYFKSRADHILWIGHQEALDLGPLAATLGLESLVLPTDSWRANKSPDAKPEVSDLARQNLREWYAKDYLFLDLCDRAASSRGRFSGSGGPSIRSNPGRSSNEPATVCSPERRRHPIGPSCTKQSQFSPQVSWSRGIAATRLTRKGSCRPTLAFEPCRPSSLDRLHTRSRVPSRGRGGWVAESPLNGDPSG